MLKGKRGFTLLEIVIVMIITAITLPVVGTAFYMLLKTPASETAKLSVLNDVNLALYWIHEDINRGQFFAGDPSMLKSINIVDFNTDPANSSAWGKLGIPASPMDRGNVCPNYSLINVSDNLRWRFGAASAAGQLDTHMFQIPIHPSIANENISQLSSVIVSWKGNSSFNASSCHTKLKIWNYSSGNGSWEEVADRSGMGQEGWLTGRRMFSDISLPTDYIQDRKLYFLAETPYYVAPSPCPNIFAWDGATYKLINTAALGKIYKRLSGTDYEPTTDLVPKEGYYDLMAYELGMDTSGFDKLGLWAVEHPGGTQILTDVSGAVHTISDPKTVTAVDSYGRDVTCSLSTAGDGDVWESDLSQKDFSNVSQLDDWITITLPSNTPREGMAKLVVAAYYAPITDLQLYYYFVYNLGSPNHDELMQKLETWEGYENGSFAASADMLLRDCLFFELEVWNGSEWVYNTEIPSIGLRGYEIALIDLSQVTDNQIRIKFPASAYTIDYVAVDWTENANVTLTELPLADAVKHYTDDLNVASTEDVLEAVSNEDGCFTTLEIGDYINYRFKALDKQPAEGMVRSFVLTSCGYFIRTGPEVAEDKSYNWELQEGFNNEPYTFRQMMYQLYTNPTEEINPSVYTRYEYPPFPTDMGTGSTHSLYTNYIKVIQLMPTTKNTSNGSTSYGGFYWLDKTEPTNPVSYSTHYYFADSSDQPHRLIREEWRDNELVSAITLAYNIQYFDDITFDFNPAGVVSTVDILPYIIVDIKASTNPDPSKGEMAQGVSHLALRSKTLTQGMAVLTTVGTGTGVDGILIAGKKLFIDGSMRTMGNITVTGEDILVTGNLINGPAEAAGHIIDDSGAIADLREYQTLSPVDWGMVVTDFVDDPSEQASNEYIWNESVNLDTVTHDDKGTQIWENSPTNTVFKPGVYYCANGDFDLSKADVSGMVTFVSPNGNITITSANSSLSPFCNGVLLFSNTSYDNSIWFAGNGGAWSGNLFAPYGGVLVTGTPNREFGLFGSIAAQTFNYSANSTATFMIRF